MKQFVIIYLDWLEVLTLSEAMVYGYIYAFTKNGLTMERKIQEIAECLHMTNNECRKALAKLEKYGLIERKRSNYSSQYKAQKITPQSLQNVRSRVDKSSTLELTNRKLQSLQNVKSRVDKTSTLTPSELTNRKLSPIIVNNISNYKVVTEKSPVNFENLILLKWLEHYRKVFSTEYVPDYRSQTTDTATLVEAVQNKMKEFGRDTSQESEAEEFIADMLAAMYHRADQWQKEHWSLHTVATQFNQLYQNALNNGKQTNPTTHVNARDNLADFFDEAKRRYGSK